MSVHLRSPAEFYIRSLIVHPDNYSDEDIAEILYDQRLIFYSEDFIARLRRKVPAPPDPFYPENQRHLPSYSYITRESINTIFLRTREMKEAMVILQRPRVKEFVEAMLEVHVPYVRIATHATQALGTYCNPDVLALYKHYFWNIDLLDATEMRLAIAANMDLSTDRIPELKKRARLMKTPYYKDARKIAADLPHSPTTAILTQTRLGMHPGRNELSVKLLEARNIAILRALEAAHQDGPGDSQKFLNYMTGSRTADEILETAQDPQGQMLDQLQSIVLRTDTKPVKTIQQLSAGRHTVEIAPTKDTADDEPDFDAKPGHRDG